MPTRFALFKTNCRQQHILSNGDLEATLKNMTSRNSVMSLAAQVAKAGLIGAPPPGLNASFGQITSYAAMSTLVGGGVNVALGRERVLLQI
ncbi:hypothetical protein [Candidatus Paracaedibacter symbiosus]|uniref:hypothetical protein n=1 Tax=Candidatus Paracaedibacter symbiosus TaxID=244582 RepID=UPI0005095C40|nr:hypothetical protein [Candidatus Paracaedibacter symbiosus]